MKRLGNTEKAVSWKSKRFSDEKITSTSTNDKTLFPSIEWYENSNFYIFKESCLKRKKKPANFPPPNLINYFNVYELDAWSRDLDSDFTLKDCLFGGVKWANNADPDKYVYTWNGIGLKSRS